MTRPFRRAEKTPRPAKTPKPPKAVTPKPPKAVTPKPPRPVPAARTAADDRHPWLRVPDLIAIGLITVTAIGASVIAMIESYTNLLEFAENHQYHGWRADIAPASVDWFIFIGELLLFVAVYRGWNAYRAWGKLKFPAAMTAWGWGLAAFGFVLSVLGNLDHLVSAGAITRAMSAVFPVAATIGLAALMMIMKRVVSDYRAKVAAAPDIRPHSELVYLLGGFPEPVRAPEPVVRQHGELLGMLGGFPARAVEAPARPKRKRPAAVTQTSTHPAVAAVEPVPELPAPARPTVVPDPAPRTGQVSRPIVITDDIWALLESGVTGIKLASLHPELGGTFRVCQIVDAYREGRLVPGTRENVGGEPVEWAAGPGSEVASSGG
jgi:hypothetical protein